MERYRGFNQLILGGGEWATFKQIKDEGGTIIKGSKAMKILIYKPITIKEDDSQQDEREENNEKIIPLVKAANVFNIEHQVEGLEPKRVIVHQHHSSINACEQLLNAYSDRPEVINGVQAAYSSQLDVVMMPDSGKFNTAEGYYATLFHELTHSTGHVNRLNRNLQNKFGSTAYAYEELIAEMGAALLCRTAQIDHKTIENTSAYIQSWLQKLQGDPQMLVRAASLAEKAYDYMNADSQLEVTMEDEVATHA
ncbi:hypothetical protein DH09_00975 (plasmid) [Bacillaceae bacterium JMAK1]|uniref:Antirestriction protein ArdC n=2 Tax=Geomicrobium sediminis TaxID=1347788 RepID=A0ABS2PFW1_9BACL|nr:hypothetical protein DH09_00975 [Bacillaceae bacterium JMAK1]MBM7634241.1 antirestriction protein ArdC [Geomicrobium sediminis]